MYKSLLLLEINIMTSWKKYIFLLVENNFLKLEKLVSTSSQVVKQIHLLIDCLKRRFPVHIYLIMIYDSFCYIFLSLIQNVIFRY